jgi:ABC-2 type transport system ATP-binding protein
METLEIVGLAERYKSKVKTFSHGMKQRLGIAQAIMHDPELIILDEPTIGLDPHGMKEIRTLILELSKNQHKTVFLSSHILSEVELVADRMIIIDKGKTVVEGNVSELLNSDSVRVLFGVNDSVKALALIATTVWNDKIQSIDKNEIVFSINHEEVSELNKYLIENGIQVFKIVPTRSLEEYFLKITSGIR